jgi:antirestriction protein ArdC
MKDIYQQVSEAIIAQLEAGTMPWRKPWNADHAAGRITRPLRHNLVPYSGINVLVLWMTAEAKGYSAPIWMTFKQALELGGCVRKGEKAATVTYADTLKRKDEETDEEKRIFFLKTYSVFNVEQIDGLPAHFYAKASPPRSDMERITTADVFIANTGAVIEQGSTRAAYSETHDKIYLPPFATFEEPEAFYGTALHELMHWTKHPSRLARDLGRKKWGDAGYAAEEIVAELGSAFLCADLDVTPRIVTDTAPYIAGWLKAMKEDKRFIFTAASLAQKAADYLHGLQPQAGEQAA